MFKSYKIGAPVFAPDYSSTCSKCELTPNEHSMYIRFLCHVHAGRN
jgi:hypothetical protein